MEALWRRCEEGKSSRISLDPLQHLAALAQSCLSEVRRKFLLGCRLKPHRFVLDPCGAELAQMKGNLQGAVYQPGCGLQLCTRCFADVE